MNSLMKMKKTSKLLKNTTMLKIINLMERQVILKYCFSAIQEKIDQNEEGINLVTILSGGKQ